MRLNYGSTPYETTNRGDKIYTGPVDLKSLVGEEAVGAATEISNQSDLTYQGAKEWNIWEEESKYFRPEWRQEGNSLVYLFYDVAGPYPQYRYDDPTAVRINEKGHKVPLVQHGENVFLGGKFPEILNGVAAHVFLPLIHRMRMEETILAWRLDVPAAATKLAYREKFTNSFFRILDATCGGMLR